MKDMGEYFHAVTLDKDLCMGCINCIKRCPTEAIRVRNGKAHILSERCVDCGECIRVCPHHAKKALSDKLENIWHYDYKIALPPPSLYGQFNNMDDQDIILNGLLGLGFDEVYEVGRAAELVSEATRRILASDDVKKPVISSACPAVTRLIRVRFPHLIDNILPLVSPMEYAARLAKQRAVEKTGLPEHRIGCFFLTPCPAKVSVTRSPLGSTKSYVDGAIAVKDIYPALLAEMKKNDDVQVLAEVGRIGMGWAESGGEAAALMSTDSYLAADGIENVIRVLEDLEDEKYSNLEFVELNACPGGCVGGVLQVENPYIAKAKIKKMRRYIPVSMNHLDSHIPMDMFWDSFLHFEPVFQLGPNRKENIEKYNQMEQICEQLPGLDCGCCGAPTCRSFAEDIVRGKSEVDDCTILMRARMEAVLKALGKDGK
jgi:iron only hydrogenase large subunit-like protein